MRKNEKTSQKDHAKNGVMTSASLRTMPCERRLYFLFTKLDLFFKWTAGHLESLVYFHLNARLLERNISLN